MRTTQAVLFDKRLYHFLLYSYHFSNINFKVIWHYHEYLIMSMYIICNNRFAMIINRIMFVLIEHEQNGMKNIGMFYVPFCLLWCYYTRTLMLRTTRCPTWNQCKMISMKYLKNLQKITINVFVTFISDKSHRNTFMYV